MSVAPENIHSDEGKQSWFGEVAQSIGRALGDFSLAQKTYGAIGPLMVVTAFLLVTSIQSVLLETGYRHLQGSSASVTINIGRVNALIYAIEMESRGVYMSNGRAEAKQFADELVRRNRELAAVVAEWQEAVGDNDAEEFSAFKRRIGRFIDSREELVRRAVEISPAAAREWGDNEANRTLRKELNDDLEALAEINAKRIDAASELGNKGSYAAWYLFALGLAAMSFAALNILIMRKYVVRPLSEITQATALITAGKTEVAIPYTTRHDEIGRLSRAVRYFRDAVDLNAELRQLELGIAQERDAALGERDKLSDKYHETKWLLLAAIKNVRQGVVMLDSKATVLAINDQYRKMYGLPPTIKAGSTLEDILQHRVKSGLFKGEVAKYLADIVDRIATRKPTSHELVLSDGRIISIQEQAMDGGGWIAVHEDVTEQHRKQRMLERTERFLATVIENIPEGIIAKDARNLRYVFLNRAAEQIIGMKRGEVVGRTARELFSTQAADVIERRDRQLIAQQQQPEPIIDIIDSPVKGKRTIAARRLQIGSADEESHVLVTMFEDRTEMASPSSEAA